MMPPTIFCPKCGEKMEKAEIAEAAVMAGIIAQGYSEGCHYVCPCGVIAILLKQELPKSPTFSLLFDLYAVGART